MTAWKDVERAEPEFAQRVQELFDGHRHKTIATVRANGSPRISGRVIPAPPIAEGPPGDRFSADIDAVVHTHLDEKATMLVVEWWTPTHGLRRIERT